jgi:dTMP kinase
LTLKTTDLLITFEGIDGCGKSTQIGLLKDWLTQKNIPFSVFREPGGTKLSEKIRALLLNSKDEMDPATELLLFSAARSQLIAEKVKPRLRAGEWVILDRFYDSTTAYQGYGRRSASLDQIESLNRLAGHGLVPDITFYLKISPEDADKRTAGAAKDRMESLGEQFFRDVARGFDRLSEENTRILTLDATQAPEAIHAQIVKILEGRLS